jgi:hypothetical protein
MRQWVRFLICVLVLCSSTIGAARHAAALPSLGSSNDQPLEVRLRRLHLVRPDLIPYPLDIEVVC